MSKLPPSPFVQGIPAAQMYPRELPLWPSEEGGWATVTNGHVLSQLLKIPKWTCTVATHSLGVGKEPSDYVWRQWGGKGWDLLLSGDLKH